MVTVNAETLDAEVAGTGPGSGPVSIVDAAELAARADMYAAIRTTSGAVLSFGRSRRLATVLQRLAVIVRDGGRCAFGGCDASHDRCDVHHVVEFEHGGGGLPISPIWPLLCRAHHAYLHSNRLLLIRSGQKWDVTANTEWADTG